MGKYLDYNGVKYLWQKAIAKFAPIARALPSGGTVGQVLTKTGVGDYVCGWAAPGGGSQTVLYSNAIGKGANTTVGLSASAANYDYLDFVFTDGNRQYMSRLYGPDGKTFSLFRSVVSGTSIYHNAMMGSVSGTTVSLGAEAQSYMTGNSISTSSSTSLKVIAVRGGTL